MNLLPANKPNRFDAVLHYLPRTMYPVHAHGKDWSIDLVMLPMKTIRNVTSVKCKEFPRARENLQLWIDNLGPALYNPIEWRWINSKPKWRGAHRLRALEALDFNFIYATQYKGRVITKKIPPDERKLMQMNYRDPVASARPPTCCNYRTKIAGFSKDLNYRKYKCRVCGKTISLPLVYPEPV